MGIAGKSVTLCLMCKKYCGGCNWARSLKPVEGWTARIIYNKDNTAIKNAWVGWCPKFLPDEKIKEIFTKWEGSEAIAYINREYGKCTKVRYAHIRYCFKNLEFGRRRKNEKDTNGFYSRI